MALSLIFDINQEVISENNDESIKFFGQDLVDITFKLRWCVEKAKRYQLILKLAIPSSERRFIFVIFLDSHLIVDAYEI